MNKNNRISEFSLILITQDNHTFLVASVGKNIQELVRMYKANAVARFNKGCTGKQSVNAADEPKTLKCM